MELQFKTKNPKQLQAASYWVDDTTEQLLYGGAKGGGKSYLGASLIFGDALIYPETHYFIARQELNDLTKFTIPTIHEVFQKWGVKFDDYATYNGQDHVFYLKNGSKVYLLACKEIPSDPLYERFGSMQMTRGWIEEAGEVAENAKSNLWLSIGRWKNKEYNLKKKLLLTANPKKNYLKRDFVDPFHAGTLTQDKKFVKALPTDNTYLPEDYITTLSSEKDRVRRQRLFEGNWDYDDDKDCLVSTDALSDLFTNTIDREGEVYLVADIARKGEDRTVITYWEDLELVEVYVYTKQTTDITAQKIRDLAASKRVPFSHILIDEDGIGGGVVDNLSGVKGFTANSRQVLTARPIQTNRLRTLTEGAQVNFANIKSQCGFKAAELINTHKMAIRTPEYRATIIEELSAILREKDSEKEGKLRLIPKEDVKEMLGRSPDIGDCILMRAYFDVLEYSAPEQSPYINIQQAAYLDQNRARIAQSSTR